MQCSQLRVKPSISSGWNDALGTYPWKAYRRPTFREENDQLKPSTKDSRPNMTQLHYIHPIGTLKCERSRTPLWFQLALDGIHWTILFQGIHRWIVKLFLQLPYVSTRQADLMKYRSGRKSSCYGLMNWIPEPVWLLFFKPSTEICCKILCPPFIAG